MYITHGHIETTVPPVRSKVGVDVRIIQVVVLLEERVTDVLRAVDHSAVRRRKGLRLQSAGGAVVVGRRHARRHAVDVGRGASEGRRVLPDERVEDIRRDQAANRGTSSIAAVNSILQEILINEAGVITKAADEAVALEIEIAVKPDDVAMIVAIEERAAQPELLDGPVTH